MSTRYEVSYPIGVGVHEILFTVSPTSGGELYMDGLLVASTPAKPGVVNLAGLDMAGIGMVHSVIAANYANFSSNGAGNTPNISVIKTEVWASPYAGP